MPSFRRFSFFFLNSSQVWGDTFKKHLLLHRKKEHAIFSLLSFPKNNNRKFLKFSVDRFKLGESDLKVNSTSETPTTDHFRSLFERLVW